MATIYFTITGTKYFHGDKFLEPDMKVTLEKDLDNEYDAEAIKVTLPGLGAIGHVANSVATRIGESQSAGRIYDKIGDKAEGKVLFVLPAGVLCELYVEENK